VADKGFGSDCNFETLKNSNLKYIIPLKRGNLYVKDAIPASQAGYDTAFTFHGRNVFAKTFGSGGPTVHLFLDS
jgi:transposase